MAPDAITLMTFCLVANVAISHFRELSKYFQYSHAIVYYGMAKALNLAKSMAKKKCHLITACPVMCAVFRAGTFLLFVGLFTVRRMLKQASRLMQGVWNTSHEPLQLCFQVSPLLLLIKPLISAFAPRLLKTSPRKISGLHSMRLLAVARLGSARLERAPLVPPVICCLDTITCGVIFYLAILNGDSLLLYKHKCSSCADVMRYFLLLTLSNTVK